MERECARTARWRLSDSWLLGVQAASVRLIPLIVLAEYIRTAVALQLVLLLPVIALYFPLANDTLTTPDSPWSPSLVHVGYVPYMMALWAGGAAAWIFGLAYARRRGVAAG